MRELIAIYNADSTVFAQVADFARKIVAPSTYACDLCKITYGPFAMHQQWREWLTNLAIPYRLLHRDEAAAYLNAPLPPLPCILLKEGDAIVTLISRDNMQTLTTIPALITALEAKLAALDAKETSQVQ